jgi:hypothetical protein
MPATIKVIQARDFLKVTSSGDSIDLEKSKKALLDIAAAAASLNDFHILIDTRKAQSSKLSVVDLWHLAGELSDHGKAFLRKTAVLCPAERFDRAKFFALCAANRGFRVESFISFEEAMEWLTS